jgi:hypothetical protein
MGSCLMRGLLLELEEFGRVIARPKCFSLEVTCPRSVDVDGTASHQDINGA